MRTTTMTQHKDHPILCSFSVCFDKLSLLMSLSDDTEIQEAVVSMVTKASNGHTALLLQTEGPCCYTHQ